MSESINSNAEPDDLDSMVIRETLTEAWDELPSLEKEELVDSVKRIWRTFNLKKKRNSDQSLTHRGYMIDSDLARAYLFGYCLPNAVKVSRLTSSATLDAWISSQVSSPPSASQNVLKVADLGAGPLTASLGFLSKLAARIQVWERNANQAIAFQSARIHILVHETSPAAVAAGRGILERVKSRLRGLEVTIAHKPKRPASELIRQAQFVFLANIWNELDEATRGQWCDELTSKIRDRSEKSPPSQRLMALCLLEPGSEDHALHFQKLRDELAKTASEISGLVPHDESLEVFPCPHLKPCPIGQFNNKDWCWFRMDWSAPDWFQNLSQEAGLKRSNLTFAAFNISWSKPTESKVKKWFEPRSLGEKRAPQMQGRWVSDKIPVDRESSVHLLCQSNGTLARIDSDEQLSDSVQRGLIK